MTAWGWCKLVLGLALLAWCFVAVGMSAPH
jgi:hypothetical protein